MKMSNSSECMQTNDSCRLSAAEALTSLSCSEYSDSDSSKKLGSSLEKKEEKVDHDEEDTMTLTFPQKVRSWILFCTSSFLERKLT